MGRPLLLLAFVALLLPSKLGWFAGVPLERWPEFALLVLLLPLAVSTSLREEVVRPLGRRGSPAALAALGLVLCLKLILLAWAPSGGFDSCYRSTLAEPLGGGCEVSFDDPFGLSGATRVDRRLDFGPRGANAFFAAQGSGVLTGSGPLSASNWNLSFFNSDRFGFYLPDEPDRDRLPFVLSTRGEIELDRAETLTVGYIGEGRLSAGGRSVELEPSYDAPAEAELDLEAGRQPFELEFAFRRIARLPEPGRPASDDPYAELRLQAGGEPLAAAVPLGWRLPAALADGVLVLLGLALLARWAWLLRGYAAVAAGVCVAIAAARKLDGRVELGSLASFGDAFWDLLALVALLGVLLWRPGARPLQFAWFSVVALAVARTFDEFPFEDSLIHLSRADPLHYASQANQILATASPQGGEDVFFFQPGMRYVLFAGRVLFGATDPWLSAAALSALLVPVFMLALTFRPSERTRRVAAFAVAAMLLGVLFSSPAVGNMRVNLSEWSTWALFPLAVLLLFGSERPRWWLLGTVLLGIELTVRSNQAPLVAVVLLAFLIRAGPRRRLALACCGAFVLVALLPLGHNLVYGERFELLATGGVEPSITPSRVTGSEGGSRTATYVSGALYVDPDLLGTPRTSWIRSADLKPFVYGLELAWLVAVGFAVAWRRRLRADALVLLAAPLAAVGVFLAYSPSSLYPRHVVICFLAFGVPLLYLLSDRARTGLHDEGAANRPPLGSPL